jgi:hypothetical protein
MRSFFTSHDNIVSQKFDIGKITGYFCKLKFSVMKQNQEKAKKSEKEQQENEMQNLEKFIKQKEQQNNILKKILESLKPSVKKTTKQYF